MKSRLRLVFPAFIVMVSVAPASAQDTIARARELYVSAAYEQALATLERLRATPDTGNDVGAVERYRAFCLLALGRTSDAQSAIEAAVNADPMFRPSDGDASPRVRSMFVETLRKLLPTIIEGKYSRAKAAFDQHNYDTAKAGFNEVLTMMADPILEGRAAQPPLADLRTLATGFEELSAKIGVAPPLPALPLETAPPAPEPPRPVVAPRIFTTADANVVAPTSLRQELPTFRGRAPNTMGVLEIVINERGLVESASMRTSISSAYDKLALAATTAWRYKPATIDGEPVKFRKLIQIAVKSDIP